MADERRQEDPQVEGLRGIEMRTPDDVSAMLALTALGWGSKRIASELGCARNTVKRWLAAGGWCPPASPKRAGRLDGLEDWLAERFRRHAGNADVVRQELAAEKGVAVSLRTVERAVAPLRRELRAEARATVRFETRPGQQLQVDFGERRVEIAGEQRRISFFVATLGHSRRLHVRAFERERPGSAGSRAWRAPVPRLRGRDRGGAARQRPRARREPRPGEPRGGARGRGCTPSPGTGASGSGPARPTGPGPRARTSAASAT